MSSTTGKKRKISDPGGSKLDLALAQLRELRVLFNEVLESDPTPADTLTNQLDVMIATLESRVNSPPVCIAIIFLQYLVKPYFS